MPTMLHFPISGLTDPEKCRTHYIAVQQQGVVSFIHEGETHIRAVEIGETPEYWALYGRKTSGEAEWVADFDNELMSWLFTAILATILGVPVEGHIFNIRALEAAVYMMNVQGATN